MVDPWIRAVILGGVLGAPAILLVRYAPHLSIALGMVAMACFGWAAGYATRK